MSEYDDESDVIPEPSTSGRSRPSNARRAMAIAMAAILVVVFLVGGGLAWAFWTFSHQPGAPTVVESTDPASPAGTIAPGDSTESTTVPDVVQLPLEVASDTLSASGLKVGTITRVFVDGYPVGSVVSQTPASKTNVPVGSTIALAVSKGTVSAQLPAIVGLTVAQAKAALATAGLKVSTVHYVYDDKVKSGIVLSLASDGPRQPQRGDSVSLTASKGRTPVVMPAIVGMSPAQALAACRALGLGLTLRPSGASSGVVYRQSPSAGSDIVPGSFASASIDLAPRASISARITKFDDTWEKYNNQLGAHITCTSTSSDDRTIASLRWQVQGVDVNMTGSGSEISFILPGYRRYGSTAVTLSVVDSAGQTSSVRKVITVNWDTGTLQ